MARSSRFHPAMGEQSAVPGLPHTRTQTYHNIGQLYDDEDSGDDDYLSEAEEVEGLPIPQAQIASAAVSLIPQCRSDNESTDFNRTQLRLAVCPSLEVSL